MTVIPSNQEKSNVITYIHTCYWWYSVLLLSDPAVYNSPPALSVTVTLNWYCCPPCSPDTTPEVSGIVTVPLTPSTAV